MMSTTNKMPTTDKNWKTVMAQGLAHGDEALAPSGKSYTCIQDSQGAKKMHNHAKNKLSGFGAPSIAVVAPPPPPAATHGDKAAKPKQTISKKSKDSQRSKDIILNRDTYAFDLSKLKNPKKNPPVRIMGSTMRNINDPDHKTSRYDTDDQRERILATAFVALAAGDAATAIKAHCKVLMIHDGWAIGENGDSSASKYCNYVSNFVRPGGFECKSDFNVSNRDRAEGIAKTIADEIVDANPSGKTNAKKHANNLMCGFDKYCELLEKEKVGTINADPPTSVPAPVIAPAPIADAAEPPAKKAKHGTNNHEASSSSDSAPVTIEMNEHSGTIVEELD